MLYMGKHAAKDMTDMNYIYDVLVDRAAAVKPMFPEAEPMHAKWQVTVYEDMMLSWEEYDAIIGNTSTLSLFMESMPAHHAFEVEYNPLTNTFYMKGRLHA